MQDSTGLPLPVAPLGFRENDLFLGFDLELHQIDTKLSTKRRASGASTVLIWGPPGSGKSHLAREYLWKHRPQYTGGTFWIDAKSEQSCLRSFWDLGQARSVIDKIHFSDADEDQDTHFVDSVRGWFESRDNWLLVFDGIAFDSDADLEDFVKYLPNATDQTGNSIIFTSHDKTLAKRQRLLNPAALKVRPLTVEDARTLLFSSLDINPKAPSSSQIEKANELVKHYGCLPLAVHAAAHALIAQGKSLDRYAPGPSSKKLAEPYLEIIRALHDNNRTEAINLMRLLMFFNHSVPVALLTLGKRTLLEQNLEIRSVDREGSSKLDLDNTIAILIRYGLIERTLERYRFDTSLSPGESFTTINDTDQSANLQLVRFNVQDQADEKKWLNGDHSPTASDGDSTKQSLDRPGSSLASSSARSVSISIDILRVHTVIQQVLRDEMRLNSSTKQAYWTWLALASKLLCASYAQAHDRIRTEGLIRDYREYDIQAARIWSHFPKRPTPSTLWLKPARRDLNNVIRTIRVEVESRSSSPAMQYSPMKVCVSIFERGSYSSSDEQDSPNGLRKVATWGSDDDLQRRQSESPVSTHEDLSFEVFDAEDDWDDAEDSQPSSVVTTRRSSRSDATETPMSTSPQPEVPRSPRASFLQAMFKGRPVLGKHPRDLGEVRPLPVPPTVSDIRAQSSRGPSRPGSSDDATKRPLSAGSEAEARLAAINRRSPLSSPQLASLTMAGIPGIDGNKSRRPLSVRPANIPSASTQPDAATKASHHARARSESTTQHLSALLPSTSSNPTAQQVRGYTSQPMTRDHSAQSAASAAQAPDPATSLSTSLPVRSSSFRDVLQSIPARLLEFGRFGDRANITPTSPTFPSSAGGLFFKSDIRPEHAVQFGLMDPVALGEARGRAEEWRRGREREREGDGDQDG